MIRKYCDKCEKEITSSDYYEIKAIYNYYSEYKMNKSENNYLWCIDCCKKWIK
jgi:hypothetical protein